MQTDWPDRLALEFDGFERALTQHRKLSERVHE
jgi:hypothetical protein